VKELPEDLLRKFMYLIVCYQEWVVTRRKQPVTKGSGCIASGNLTFV